MTDPRAERMRPPVISVTNTECPAPKVADSRALRDAIADIRRATFRAIDGGKS